MGEGTRVESDVALSSLVGLGLKGVTFIEPPPIPSYGLRGRVFELILPPKQIQRKYVS